jgi:hypothetical protein
MDMNDINKAGKLGRQLNTGSKREDLRKRARRSGRGQDRDLVPHSIKLLAQPPDDSFRAAVPDCGYDVIEYQQDVHTRYWHRQGVSGQSRPMLVSKSTGLLILISKFLMLKRED